MSGILNVNKPAGVTSHDVVNFVRRLSGQRRVGHAGTLDPLATGVLVVCLGWTTRLSQYLMEGTKRYRAVLRLGAVTDTHDAEGTIVATVDDVDVTREDLSAALARFKGALEQVPPMYSAVKCGGTPLYKLARHGEVVERPKRSVYIYELVLEKWDMPFVTLSVLCSKGTYIRSLVHDLGQQLGCGAYLDSLTRLASGPFRLEETVSLEELARAFDEGRASSLFFPLGRALPQFDRLVVDDEAADGIRHGRPVEGQTPIHGDLSLAFSRSGEPLALLQYDDGRRRWQPIKVFSR